MTAINSASLKNPAVQCKLAGGMRRAISNSKSGFMSRYGIGHHTVTNKKGEAFVVIRYHRATKHSLSGFTFFCPYDGHDVTTTVLQSLRT
jgi:hypothetical protein